MAYVEFIDLSQRSYGIVMMIRYISYSHIILEVKFSHEYVDLFIVISSIVCYLLMLEAIR